MASGILSKDPHVLQSLSTLGGLYTLGDSLLQVLLPQQVIGVYSAFSLFKDTYCKGEGPKVRPYDPRILHMI